MKIFGSLLIISPLYAAAVLIIVSFLLYRFARKFYLNGYIVKDFVIENNGKISLYFFVEHELPIFLTKWKLKKLNPFTGEYDFSVKMPYGTRYSEILGISDNFLFAKKNFSTAYSVCLITGRIKFFTKETIKLQNRELPEFSMGSLIFSKNKKTPAFKDENDNWYLLDVKTLNIETVNEEDVKKEGYEYYKRLDNYRNAEIQNSKILEAQNKFINYINSLKKSRSLRKEKVYCFDNGKEVSFLYITSKGEGIADDYQSSWTSKESFIISVINKLTGEVLFDHTDISNKLSD